MKVEHVVVRQFTRHVLSTVAAFSLMLLCVEGAGRCGEPRRLKVSDSPVVGVCFSNNGKMIVTASEDNMVKAWRTNGYQRVTEFLSPTSGLSQISLFPNAPLVAMSSFDSVAFVDYTTGRRQSITTVNGGPVTCVRVSRDGKRIAVGTYGDEIRILRDNGTLAAILPGHVQGMRKTFAPPRVNSVAFSNDSQLLASASSGGSVVLWNLSSFKEVRRMTYDNGDAVVAACFSPNDKSVASVSFEGKVIVWDTSTGAQRGSLMLEGAGLEVEYSRDGKVIVVADSESGVSFLDASRVCRVESPKFGDAACFAISPDGNVFVTGHESGEVRIHDGIERLKRAKPPGEQ
jgi:WD40 repeat protein